MKKITILFLIFGFYECYHCPCGQVVSTTFDPAHSYQTNHRIGKSHNSSTNYTSDRYFIIGKCLDSDKTFSVYRNLDHIYNIGDSIKLKTTERPSGYNLSNQY